MIFFTPVVISGLANLNDAREENSWQVLKVRPRVSLHTPHRRRNDWRTLSKIPGVVFILSAATTILTTRSSAESTGVSYAKDFMCPQKKKSSGLRSGERGGQATGPPRPIYRTRYVFKECRAVLEKCAGAPSCINHMSLWMGSGPMFHGNYCLYGWVLSSWGSTMATFVLFCKNNLDSS
ncbi:hypothetical protein AVEN_188860-1 [Araneus ventricosus]|uniref:Uncharacterized protein n=1 Tax=Araneus ventricosus TaxID=182803 RepID=A0A4Y2RJY9_ARAVE|nr:hypothetical protein AVEN_188860-1 [Araneus ventricosus]